MLRVRRNAFTAGRSRPGLLYDRGSRREEKRVAVHALARAVLLARNDALAAFTIADEDAALCRPDKDAAILAVVHLNLSHVVAHVDVAILAVLDDEHLAIDRTRRLDAYLPLWIVIDRLPQ